jgi:hypothetical protein
MSKQLKEHQQRLWRNEAESKKHCSKNRYVWCIKNLNYVRSGEWEQLYTLYVSVPSFELREHEYPL